MLFKKCSIFNFSNNTTKYADKPYLRRFQPNHVYISTLTFACKHLTKHCPNDVITWLQFLLKQFSYCEYKRGFWYWQCALLFEKYIDNKEKVNYCTNMKRWKEMFLFIGC